MPAGGPNRHAGDEQARPDQITLFDGGLDAPIAAARVAPGGEAAIEHGAQPDRRARGQQRQRHCLEKADIHLAMNDMHVAIDKARGERAAAAIDHFGLPASNRAFAQLAHLRTLDQKLVAAACLPVSALEQPEILEKDWRHVSNASGSYESARPS